MDDANYAIWAQPKDGTENGWWTHHDTFRLNKQEAVSTARYYSMLSKINTYEVRERSVSDTR